MFRAQLGYLLIGVGDAFEPCCCEMDGLVVGFALVEDLLHDGLCAVGQQHAEGRKMTTLSAQALSAPAVC